MSSRIRRKIALALFALLLSLSSFSSVSAATNLIANPSLESASADGQTPLNWRAGNWGNNVVSFRYPTPGALGARSATVELTSRSSGDAKWYFDPVTVQAGNTYVFSDKYTSSVSSFVTADFLLLNGSHQYIDLATPIASTNWSTASAQFVAPENVESVTIYHLINQVGSLSIDDASLSTEGTPPPPPPVDPNNLIPNPTLEVASASTTTPESWLQGGWGTNTAQFSYPVTGHESARAMQVLMSNYASGDAKWYTGLLSVTPGATYSYADYYTATVPTYITAEFRTTSGGVQYVDLGTAAESSVWVQRQVLFTVPDSVDAVRIFHLIKQNGNVVIDDLSLREANTPPPPPPTAENLIFNATLEPLPTDPNTPVDWSRGGWGTNTATLTYPVAGYESAHGLKVQISAYTSGDAKWAFKTVPVTPGVEYEFHDYYTATVQSALTAQYKMSNGSYSYAWLGTLPAQSAWTQASAVFIPPNGAQSVSIFHSITAAGTLVTSAYSLKESPLLAEGMVTLTFDDGFKSHYSTAKPILDAAGLKATFYVVSGFLDDPFADYLTPEEMLALQSAGHEIGGHTRNHMDLATLTVEQMRDEVTGGRNDLLALGVRSLTSFAYPFGSYDDRVKQAVKDAGYTNARSVNRGFNDKTSDPYLWTDQHVTSDVSAETIKGFIDQAIANKKWLFIELHEQHVIPGDIYSNSPETLQAIVDYLKQKNVKVVTVNEGLQIVK